MKNQISKFLQERIDAGDFPSAVYLVAENGEIKLQDVLGFAVVEPEKIGAQIDTIYDLASLTKPLVTGLLSAILIESRDINLSEKVAKFIRRFDTDRKREITVENLLVHASGLPAWKPFYLIANFKSEISDLIGLESLKYQIHEQVVYSDLNFMMLADILEKVYGKKLDDAGAMHA